MNTNTFFSSWFIAAVVSGAIGATIGYMATSPGEGFAAAQESAVVVPAEAVAETTSVEPQVPDAVTGEAPVEAVVTEEVSAETAPTQ